MDKFLTFPGKQPVYLGDIDFMQTAVGSALQNLMKAYTGRSDANAILYGVEITYLNNAISWTAGVVSIDGEILPISAGTVGDAAGPGYFDIVSSSSGNRTFGNGEAHDCWETRAATITKTQTNYPIADFKRIVPVDVNEAQVYGFEGMTNSAEAYARLANAGGAWIFSMRRLSIASSQLLFQANVSGLPENVLVFFATRFPSSVLSTVRVDSAESPTVPVTLSWAVVNNKLQVTVSAASALSIPNAFELREILPVFQ